MSKNNTPADPVPPDAEWRVVEWNDNYGVSEYGHLRRERDGSNSKAGKIIKPRWNGRYFQYGLQRNCEKRYVTAHVLVCEAFHGPRPSRFHQTAHWDGNSRNCHKGNLRWATALENSDDRDRHGRIPRGTDHPLYRSNLTEQKIREICSSTDSQRTLARRYGVGQPMIWSIRAGRIWKHVPRC